MRRARDQKPQDQEEKILDDVAARSMRDRKPVDQPGRLPLASDQAKPKSKKPTSEEPTGEA